MSSTKRPHLAMSSGASPFRVVVFETEAEWVVDNTPFGRNSFLVDVRSLATRTPAEVAIDCAEWMEADFRRNALTHSDLHPIPIALVGKRARDIAQRLVNELGPTRAYICTPEEVHQALEDAKTKPLYQLRNEGIERLQKMKVEEESDV